MGLKGLIWYVLWAKAKSFYGQKLFILSLQNAAAFSYKTYLWACEFERSDVAGDQGTEKENQNHNLILDGPGFWETCTN